MKEKSVSVADVRLQKGDRLRGTGSGRLLISDGAKMIGEVTISSVEEWREKNTVIHAEGVSPLYFTYLGYGMLDILSFKFD